jgi:membrane protease YdiL (CAAX protease family)
MRTLLHAAALGVAAGVLAFFPDRDDGSGSLLAGLGVFAGAVLGLRALRRVRSLPQRSVREHARLVIAALGAGVAVGLANLGVNFAMASLDASIREQMVTRWAEFSAWSVVFAGPITEEIAYRLVLLSGLAWLLSWRTRNPRTVEWGALLIASAVFGVAHIFYGGVDSTAYVIGMALKSTAWGLAFGLVFWRWGLPYSMLAHCAANGIHLLLMPLLFSRAG